MIRKANHRRGSWLAATLLSLATIFSLTMMPVLTGLGGATAFAAPAASATASSGSNQSAHISTALPMPFSLTAYDISGNLAVNNNVSWVVTSAPSGANGQMLTSVSSATDADGKASALLTLGDKKGTYVVTATVEGSQNIDVVFNAFAVMPPASASMSSGSNQSANIRAQLPNPFVVLVKDATGAPVAGTSVMWSIKSVPAGAMGMSLSASSTMTDSNGKAFVDFTLGNLSGQYLVEASVIGLEGDPIVFSANANVGASATLLTPSDGAMLAHLGSTLAWDNPEGTTQYEIRVIPMNNDGPGINLVRNVESSYTIDAPIFGSGNYVLLPGMTYTWQVRTTSATVVAGESDWSPWAFRTFKTPTSSSATISLHHLGNGSGMIDILHPTLSWENSNAEVFYYEIQISRDPNFGSGSGSPFLYWELRHGGLTSPLNSYTIPNQFGLEAGATYFWHVRPRIQGDGVAVDWSSTSSFMTSASAQ